MPFILMCVVTFSMQVYFSFCVCVYVHVRAQSVHLNMHEISFCVSVRACVADGLIKDRTEKREKEKGKRRRKLREK